MAMTEYKGVKIPAELAEIIDVKLVKESGYTSRADYIKECIRNDLRKRGLLGGSE